MSPLKKAPIPNDLVPHLENYFKANQNDQLRLHCLMESALVLVNLRGRVVSQAYDSETFRVLDEIGKISSKYN